MFIHITGKIERIINLDSVSSITLLEAEHRVVFNMAYACTMSSMGTKKDGVELADFIFWNTYTDEQLAKLLDSSYIKHNFIRFPGHNRLINKHHIASIKFDSQRNRIIVNIKCSIRLHPDGDLSSDFIFIDAASASELETLKQVALELTECQ